VVRDDNPRYGGGFLVDFRAAPGERNDLRVSDAGESEYRIEDRGATVSAGAGCRQTPDPHVVFCLRGTGTTHPRFSALLGDMNDAARLSLSGELAGSAIGDAGDDVLSGRGSTGGLDLGGGAGDDLLRGGSGLDLLGGDAARSRDATGNDRIYGGPGPDWLQGGPGDDRLGGGPGHDVLDGEGTAAEAAPPRGFPRGDDVLRGGAGVDIAVYKSRPLGAERPRRLLLSSDGRPNDGLGKERDTIARDVERAYSLRTAFVQFDTSPSRIYIVNEGRIGARLYRPTRRGTAWIESAFFQGYGTFSIREPSRADGVTEISLPLEGFESCGARSSSADASRRSRRVIHRLSGRAHGRYRTRGRNSAATIRGTDWTITDRCDGTLTKVRRGTVKVRDFGLHQTVIVRAGQSYLAKASNGP
jgi:hypothetical protein